jgi:DNA-binding GntR family transcriptional regulator
LPPFAESPEYRDLSEWLVGRILDAVKSGAIKPGERLVERDIAARFDVSRGPVRDALHKLESLGIVERRPPRGVYIRSWSAQDAIELAQLSDALIYLSVQLVADKLSEAQVKELEAILDETRTLAAAKEVDEVQLQRLDQRFHRTIAQASGNRRLIELLESFDIPLSIYPDPLNVQISPTFSLKQHTQLLDRLRARDRSGAVNAVVQNFEEMRRRAKPGKDGGTGAE